MLLARKRVLARVSNQPLRLANPTHDRIACIDALSAVNAFHLKSIANVDPSWANRCAMSTIDTVTDFRFANSLPLVPGLTSMDVIGDDQTAPV